MKVKILILLLIVGGVCLGYGYYQSVGANKSKPSVLSVQNQLKKIEKNILNSEPVKKISKDAKESLGGVLGAATQAVNDAIEIATQKAEDKIIQTSVEAVMEQVNKLPADDKEIIREKICK